MWSSPSYTSVVSRLSLIVCRQTRRALFLLPVIEREREPKTRDHWRWRGGVRSKVPEGRNIYSHHEPFNPLSPFMGARKMICRSAGAWGHFGLTGSINIPPLCGSQKLFATLRRYQLSPLRGSRDYSLRRVAKSIFSQTGCWPFRNRDGYARNQGEATSRRRMRQRFSPRFMRMKTASIMSARSWVIWIVLGNTIAGIANIRNDNWRSIRDCAHSSPQIQCVY